MAQALDLPLVREVGRKELMLGKIMGINPKLPSWGTLIMALAPPFPRATISTAEVRPGLEVQA